MEIIVVELEVQSRGPSQVPSQKGQKTFLPLGEMDLEQTLKLVMHPHPHPHLTQLNILIAIKV